MMGQPNAPSVVVGGSGSCSSNCVAAGTYVYAIVANDIYGNGSILSPGTSATTDGTQTITVSWTPINGQVTTRRFRGPSITNINSTDASGTGVSGTSYVDSSGNFYTANITQTAGTAASIGSQGLAGQQLTLTNGNFKDVITPSLTANRTQTLPDASGFIPVTGEAFSSSPRAEQNVFLPGALTSTWTGATWTTDKAVTVTRVQVQAKTAPAGCTTNAIVRLTDGTTPVNVTISAAANDSAAITQNYAAGAALTITVQTAAAGCTTSPADANVTVQYRMQ